MYVPKHFAVDDPAKLCALMREFSFATVVSHDGTAPFASHLPILLSGEGSDQMTLSGHMARANPQWHHFKTGAEVLVIFQGPHGYISPSWYESKELVPTWNYVSVHAYGRPSLIEDAERLHGLVNTTVAEYEGSRAQPWRDELPDELRINFLKAIVGFEIPISRMEGKFKLGQNREAKDIRGAISGLRNSGDPSDAELADWMERKTSKLHDSISR